MLPSKINQQDRNSVAVEIVSGAKATFKSERMRRIEAACKEFTARGLVKSYPMGDEYVGLMVIQAVHCRPTIRFSQRYVEFAMRAPLDQHTRARILKNLAPAYAELTE